MNGTLVHAQLSELNELSFTNCTFTSCKALNGYGGAIYIHADAPLSSLSFSSLYISKCSDVNTQNSSLNGNALFISSSSLTTITSYTHWNTILPSEYSNSTEGLYTIETNSIIVPLYHIIFPPSVNSLSEVYVIPEDIIAYGVIGGEIDSCGWKDFPCLTIYSASNHSYPRANSLSIHLLCAGCTHLPESLSTIFTRTTHVDSIDGRVTKCVGSINSSSPIFLIRADLSFTTISFLFTSNSTSLLFLHILSGQNTLNNTSFLSRLPTSTPTPSSSSPLLSVSSPASLILGDGIEFTNLSPTLSGLIYFTHSISPNYTSFSSSNLTSHSIFTFLPTLTSSASSFLIQRDSSPLTLTSSSILLPHSITSTSIPSSILSSSSSLTLSDVSFTGQAGDASLLCSYSLITVTSGNLSLNDILITSPTFIFPSPPLYFYPSESSYSDFISATIHSLSVVNCCCSLSSGGLFTAESSSLSLTQCSLNTTSYLSSSSSSSFSSTSEGERGDVCSWNASFILMRGCSADVSECTFNDTRDGVMRIADFTSLTLTHSSIHLSSLPSPSSSSSIPSFSIQHIILCRSSSFVMKGYNNASLTRFTSLWISESECTFTSDEETPISRLIVPILETVVMDDVEEGEHDGMYTLTFRGTLLINCSLFFFLSSSSSSHSDEQAQMTPPPVPFASFSLDSSTATHLSLSNTVLIHSLLREWE